MDSSYDSMVNDSTDYNGSGLIEFKKWDYNIEKKKNMFFRKYKEKAQEEKNLKDEFDKQKECEGNFYLSPNRSVQPGIKTLTATKPFNKTLRHIPKESLNTVAPEN